MISEDSSNLILFRGTNSSLTESSPSLPSATQSEIPDWYKEADRFAKMPNGEYYKAPQAVCPFPKPGTINDYGMIPTWKACPAILDAFMTGYVLKTPCDIKFFKNDYGKIDVRVEDDRYKSFCTKRPPMPQFNHPVGYYEDHFSWFPDWGITLPEGYSCLYMTPMNRFDLPFLNTTGVVDNDKVNLSGSFPFFVIKDWEGTIPAGTPYMQILPFKRENWYHEKEFLSEREIQLEFFNNAKKYRVPDGGVYKDKVWSRREYR